MVNPNRPPPPSYQDALSGQSLVRILTRELKYFLNIFLPTVLYLSIFGAKPRECAARPHGRGEGPHGRGEGPHGRGEGPGGGEDYGPIQTFIDCIRWDRGPLPGIDLGRETIMYLLYSTTYSLSTLLLTLYLLDSKSILIVSILYLIVNLSCNLS